MAAVNINMIKTVELVISTASVVCLLLTEKAPQSADQALSLNVLQ